MSRSFLKLVVSSLLVCGATGFAILVAYSSSVSWIDDRARTDGVFLAHQLLDEERPARRAERLRSLQPHYAHTLTLMDLDEVERRIGRPARPGEAIGHHPAFHEEWYFLVFRDGQGALAVGPVDPTDIDGFVPIGLILGIIGLPLLAAWLAIRVNRELIKVARASEQLAEGELGARVDNRDGPSNELAASFNAMAERVERLVRSREELVQAVSHELGSPLSRLRFSLELLENHPEGQRDERFAAMVRELDALDELVAELLGYVQTDETELDHQTFDPERVLVDLAELARLDAPDASEIEVDVAVSDGVRVDADPRLFQRAVENVLRNAMRHGRTRVRLELIDCGSHVRIDVHDDGPGIPEALREKVAAPFFRLEPDRGRTTGGVGLGLAIVRRILARHGGSLEIRDSPIVGGAWVAMLWPRAGSQLP